MQKWGLFDQHEPEGLVERNAWFVAVTGRGVGVEG
jgi:hypothetical protein